MSYYSYGNRIYSLNEAKEEKGKDIHIIAALKAEIKKCKSPMEKKKLQAKLMKYTEKAMNEAAESASQQPTAGTSRRCPACGQATTAEQMKKQQLLKGLKTPAKDNGFDWMPPRSVDEAKDLEDGLDDETIEKYRHLWNERNKKVCPHCGQPYKEQEAKLKAGLTSPSKDTMEDMTDSL